MLGRVARSVPSIVLAWMSCTHPAVDALGQSAKRRTVHMVLDDRNVQAQVLNELVRVAARPERDYFWCSGQRVIVTEGGYSGELLDGAFVEYHPNGQLMTQGWLSKGLRTGAWLEWNDQGRLLRSTTWRNGRKHGPSLVMDLAGGEPTNQRYRNGKLIEEKRGRQIGKEEKQEERPGNAKPIAKTKENPPKDPKDKGMSRRMRVRNEQNKGTKDEAVRKRKSDRAEKEQPGQPAAP